MGGRQPAKVSATALRALDAVSAPGLRRGTRAALALARGEPPPKDEPPAPEFPPAWVKLLQFDLTVLVQTGVKLLLLWTLLKGVLELVVGPIDAAPVAARPVHALERGATATLYHSFVNNFGGFVQANINIHTICAPILNVLAWLPVGILVYSRHWAAKRVAGHAVTLLWHVHQASGMIAVCMKIQAYGFDLRNYPSRLGFNLQFYLKFSAVVVNVCDQLIFGQAAVAFQRGWASVPRRRRPYVRAAFALNLCASALIFLGLIVWGVLSMAYAGALDAAFDPREYAFTEASFGADGAVFVAIPTLYLLASILPSFHYWFREHSERYHARFWADEHMRAQVVVMATPWTVFALNISLRLVRVLRGYEGNGLAGLFGAAWPGWMASVTWVSIEALTLSNVAVWTYPGSAAAMLGLDFSPDADDKRRPFALPFLADRTTLVAEVRAAHEASGKCPLSLLPASAWLELLARYLCPPYGVYRLAMEHDGEGNAEWSMEVLAFTFGIWAVLLEVAFWQTYVRRSDVAAAGRVADCFFVGLVLLLAVVAMVVVRDGLLWPDERSFADARQTLGSAAAALDDALDDALDTAADVFEDAADALGGAADRLGDGAADALGGAAGALGGLLGGEGEGATPTAVQPQPQPQPQPAPAERPPRGEASGADGGAAPAPGARDTGGGGESPSSQAAEAAAGAEAPAPVGVPSPAASSPPRRLPPLDGRSRKVVPHDDSAANG